MDDMASSMNDAANELGHITGDYVNTSVEDKPDRLIAQKLLLMLMMRVREKQDLLGSRVDVQGVMGEMEGANDIFLL